MPCVANRQKKIRAAELGKRIAQRRWRAAMEFGKVNGAGPRGTLYLQMSLGPRALRLEGRDHLMPVAATPIRLATIQLLIGLGLLAPLVVFDYSTFMITSWLGRL
ncbi:hypothetical protein AYJ54_01835 [Bradyrhizobium centrolobii]|uniref:Uncharacterized protein n=1 Tax=Bradyrhizobium centrolobii TaxID=1505087 RepID=A0A176YI13_9BRAD|nr:hypothetical protein AYJ54_01835 [Bradyrhizobium centrolobii]